MAEAAIALSVVSAGIKVFSAINKGDAIREEAAAKAKAHEYNAQQTEKNAWAVQREGAENERRLRVSGRAVMGRQASQFAGSGVAVGEGTALDVLENTAAAVEMDALTIRETTSNKVGALVSEARFERKKAGYAIEAGERNASAALWGGIGGAVESMSPMASAYDF